MRIWLKISLLLATSTVLNTLTVRAFSLLGPYEPWMETTNGFRQDSAITLQSSVQPADIGGPMDITSGYRWNVPVLTYGFDQSFLNYFGTNGVAAVDSAIQILNNLPPTSQITATNYPFAVQGTNYTAQALSLVDLKSTTLSLLLEQLGLAQPTRHIFVLKQWTPDFLPAPPFYDQESQDGWISWAIPDYIVQRNFDPQTLGASTYVNQNLYYSYVNTGWPGIGNFIDIIPINPGVVENPAVADENWVAGGFYRGLTYDDVGGLRYLLSTNNVNYETLLPGIVGVGTNANSFVDGAWRPGVDKISFVPQPVDSLAGAFLPMTNQFTDTYITNSVLMHQQVARMISQPDFLFSARAFTGKFSCPDVSRTGTANWINNAALNGNLSGAGPGVIQPPITIAYNMAGTQFWHDNSMSDQSVYDETFLWATFDSSTNVPIVYPMSSAGTNQLKFRMLLQTGSYSSGVQHNFEWTLAGPSGSLYNFQTSTDLVNWYTLFVVVNNSAVSDFFNSNPSSPQRFYRLIPQ